MVANIKKISWTFCWGTFLQNDFGRLCVPCSQLDFPTEEVLFGVSIHWPWTTREIAHVHAAPSTSTKHWQIFILIPMPTKENRWKPLASRKYQVGVSSPNPSSQNEARAQKETHGRNLCSLMNSPASISEPSGRGTVPVIQLLFFWCSWSHYSKD